MNRRFAPLAGCLLLGLIGHAPAIIVRHDTADAEYLELGRSYGRSLVHMNLERPGDPPDGEGTLIHPLWVLTAAHVAAEVEPGHELTIGGTGHQVRTVIFHDEWEGGARNDIALLGLTGPVADVEPVDLYRGSDEIGQTVIVVGRGDTGTGLTGPTGNDLRVRGATNRVDDADEWLIWWRFDAPGDPGVTVLEGISGPGDSGGPSFMATADGIYIAGVSSAQSTRATGGREGLYGVTEYYVRVSRYVGWIETTIVSGAR